MESGERRVGAGAVVLDVRDVDGSPTWFRVTFTDAGERTHPPAEARVSPDFWFHPQVYRYTGDVELLPAGSYVVAVTRGPEYVEALHRISVPAGGSVTLTDTLRRWVSPRLKGWYSGDHHMHGSGCQLNPQAPAGVPPEELLPHVAGEALDVAQVLAWFPAFAGQVSYFSPQPWTGSPAPLLKYDLEISGFGSHQQGHYNLLALTNARYPTSVGTSGWPTWAQPILQWARAQGALVGTAHSGEGLETQATFIPNYVVPPMNGIGAMEFFVDVTAGLVDFLATVDTDVLPELNAWYHVQSCGYTTKISGESDFPCFGRERVGRGRSYVQADVPVGQDLAYVDWIEGLRQGRAYVTDGGSHLFDFAVDGMPLGRGEVRVAGSTPVRVTATVAAWLPVVPPPPSTLWYGWNIERARRPGRTVMVDLVLNGLRIRQLPVVADGREVAIDETVWIHKSSWLALRILGSSHTNAHHVIVDGRPIRASRDSALWCESAADGYWANKGPLIAAAESPAALQAYQDAKAIWQQLATESSLGPYATAAPYGQGCASSGAPPAIGARGSPRLGSTTFAVTLAGAPPAVAPMLLLGQTKGELPIGPCAVLIGAPVLGPTAPPTSSSGTTELPLAIPAARDLEGLELFLQWVVPDPGGAPSQPWALSDGLDVHISSIEQR